MIEKKELIDELKQLESGNALRLTLSDGDTIEAGWDDYWISGDGSGFMCDMLGNVSYSSAESLANEPFNYIQKELKLEITEIDY